MSAVCFYFQVHQPFRIQRFRFANVGKYGEPQQRLIEQDYFDKEKNFQIFNKVARKSYLKTNAILLDLIRKYQGCFRISFSITGVVLEQMSLYAPDVLESFQELVASGKVEILGETYYHSLAALYDDEEFIDQVEEHRSAMLSYFQVVPQVFRNTELIYQDQIGELIHGLGFKGILAEGADDILEWRSPNFVYQHPHVDLKILPKNYKLSDDIAFRFSNRGWSEYPVSAEKYANWVHALSGSGDTVNLFMDYETFGEHQWEDTGIFEFLRYLPEFILRHPDWEFLTPSEVLKKYPSRGSLHYDRNVSWADTERDTSAWTGNDMQGSALRRIYKIGQKVKQLNDPAFLKTWRRLLTSDHFYYMCTKFFSDGDVHAYFSPFKSPYHAFLNYLAILEDFDFRLEKVRNEEKIKDQVVTGRGKFHGETRPCI